MSSSFITCLRQLTSLYFRYIMTNSTMSRKDACPVHAKTSPPMEVELRALTKAGTHSNSHSPAELKYSRASRMTLCCAVIYMSLHLTPRLQGLSHCPPLVPTTSNYVIMSLKYSIHSLNTNPALTTAYHSHFLFLLTAMRSLDWFTPTILSPLEA